MDKGLLLRHIKGELSEMESERVIAWIDESEQNEAYYVSLMNTVVAEDVTREKPSINLTQEEKAGSYAKIEETILQKGRGNVRHLIFSKREPDASRRAIYFSACAILLLMLSIGINLMQYSDRKRDAYVTDADRMAVRVAELANNEQTFYTNNGVKARIMLPDSSLVWLNSGSAITYTQSFTGSERLVKFSGEGYFEVRKNEAMPMVVTTPKGMKITVLGTKFHICSYDNDVEEQATLFSGKINISRVDGEKTLVKEKELRPSESVKFGSHSEAILTTKADTTKKIAWKRGELLFEKTPMDEVIKKLERWHGVDITVKDSTVMKYHFTAEFGSESIVQILELLRFTTPIDFTIDKNKVQLHTRNN